MKKRNRKQDDANCVVDALLVGLLTFFVTTFVVVSWGTGTEVKAKVLIGLSLFTLGVIVIRDLVKNGFKWFRSDEEVDFVEEIEDAWSDSQAHVYQLNAKRGADGKLQVSVDEMWACILADGGIPGLTYDKFVESMTGGGVENSDPIMEDAE